MREIIEMLRNPFTAGDILFMPANAEYINSRGKRSLTKTEQSIVVRQKIVSVVRCDDSSQTLEIIPPSVQYRNGGKIEEVILTEEILRLNNKPVEYSGMSVFNPYAVS